MTPLRRRLAAYERPAAIVGATLVVVGFLVAFTTHRGRTATPERPASTPEEAATVDAGIIAWCAEGLEPIVGGGCFAPATADAGEPMMLVYLHGMYPPASASEELDRQSRLAKAATAQGFSVLALRGRQGQCAGEEVIDYWCWPSNERVVAAGQGFVDAWGAALVEAERRAGRGKHYLLGFSNGGYFAALIATRALMPFDAIAIAHAGPVEPVRPMGPKVPLLLVTADGDPSTASMMLLDTELTSASWPHAIVTRDGSHSLTDGDIAFALTFFLRTPHEPFPLAPPLSSRAPVAYVPEADADADADADAEPLPALEPAPLDEAD